MSYELFCEGSVNVEASYPSRTRALEVLGRAYREHGRAYLTRFLLARTDRRGEYHTVADGADLADLVERALAEPRFAVRKRRTTRSAAVSAGD